MDEKDIILFAKYNFHFAGLRPISNHLHNLGIPHTLTSKRHYVYDLFNERKKQFKIFLIADEWGSLFRETAETLITIGHSMANKNTTLSFRNNDMDYICVPSSYYKTQLLMRNVVPRKEILITGYPFADRILNKKFKYDTWWSRDALSKNLAQKNILICPTYNKDLSVVDELINSEKVIGKLANDFYSRNPRKIYRIAFKPHPVLPKKYPEQVNRIKQISEKYGSEFFHYHEDSHEDISDAILWSDAIIGDCSGAILLGLAGEKPILAYNNPNRRMSEYFDEEGPEWSLRENFAYQFEDFSVVPKILEEIFFIFDGLKPSRTHLKTLLYGEHAEDASKVVAGIIKKLAL